MLYVDHVIINANKKIEGIGKFILCTFILYSKLMRFGRSALGKRLKIRKIMFKKAEDNNEQ